jgi:hypothetical protein
MNCNLTVETKSDSNGGSAVLFAMKGEQYSQKQQITGY